MRLLPALTPLLLIVSCGSKPAGAGSKVTFHYEMIIDGIKVETTRAGRPMTAVMGKGDLLAGLEEALAGLRKGNSRRVELPPDKAFGSLDPGKIERIPSERFGKMLAGLKPGMKVQGMTGGRPAEARVVSAEAKDVVLDFNHPRAGKRVVFEIEVLDVR